MRARVVEAAQGWGWYVCGWRFFTLNPGMWIAFIVLNVVIALVLKFIPVIGGLLYMLIAPALYGGFLYAARELDRGNDMEVGHLFVGLSDPAIRSRVLALGGISIAVSVFTMLVMFMSVGSAMLDAGAMGHGPGLMGVSVGAMLGILISLAVNLLVAMAFVYAVPLVMLDGGQPMDALKSSFDASCRNWLPLLVYGVIYIPLVIVAVIPVGLGLLVFLPVSFAALYCSYKSLYVTAVQALPSA